MHILNLPIMCWSPRRQTQPLQTFCQHRPAIFILLILSLSLLPLPTTSIRNIRKVLQFQLILLSASKKTVNYRKQNTVASKQAVPGIGGGVTWITCSQPHRGLFGPYFPYPRANGDPVLFVISFILFPMLCNVYIVYNCSHLCPYLDCYPDLPFYIVPVPIRV